ncbi:MAG: glycosyl hydrolase [Kiritimatiellia bacterium]
MKHLLIAVCVVVASVAGAVEWPVVTRTMKPWAYNWWMGSAVDEAGLRLQIEEMERARMGGFHVIPIYSVKGNPNDRELLSPQWMAAWGTAVRLAGEKGMGVDLTMGSGWCFGGAHLAPEEGCWMLEVNSKRLAQSKVLWRGVDAEGRDVVLSARPTGQKVKRSGPGAHGPMMNPFSSGAMTSFLKPFTAAYDRPGVPRPGRMYHDSYEYFGANWAWELPAAFAKRRGYRLEDHYAELAGVGDADAVARVKCDYRETLAEMIVEDVFPLWQDWCRARGVETRNEAHGSPANWLDFYVMADIPETEMFSCDKARAQFPTVSADFMNSGDRDILISKFASSAAHVKHAGARVAPLVSSETCTWVCEHFCETVGAVKTFVDRLLLAGVNHVYYHGMNYSPADAKWPGWTFYATCEMNRFNPVWRDVDILNAYIARVQSIAQTAAADNDVLVYWPLHDYWMEAKGFERQLTVHDRAWFDGEEIGRVSRALYDAGYSFDFISEKMLATLADARATRYTTIVVPHARVMRPATLARLFDLAKKGYQVRFTDALPATVPGLKDVAAGEAELARRTRQMPAGVRVVPLEGLFASLPARREPFNKASGLMYVRYAKDGATYYFIANQLRDEGVTGVFRPSVPCRSAEIMDPLSGRITPLAVEDGAVRLSLAIGESTILVVSGEPGAAPQAEPVGLRTMVALDGVWRRVPVAGGPERPAAKSGRLPLVWGKGDAFPESAFAGTMRYETTATLAGGARGRAELCFGRVAESARVFVNGRPAGAAIMAPWKVSFDAALLRDGENTVAIEVTSSGANRLRWLDAAKPYPWKTFTDINMVDINYRRLDASGWQPHEYGLYGPVTLTVSR